MIALFCRALDFQDIHAGGRDMYFNTPGKRALDCQDAEMCTQEMMLLLCSIRFQDVHAGCRDMYNSRKRFHDVHAGCRDMYVITPGKGRLIRNDDLVLQGIRFHDVHAGCRDMYVNTPGKGRLIRNDDLVL
ncbi:hypothetical protein CEXT_572001 [Caerostris extrusa]|uniref:Uncharacterized protein n=1 Tax=Caerostris extrusa TaxID=172846 RepID=A0AAV4TPX1_CAEEX|nr:hypothetical protein CEXT_572001 [Caerostris extrusa]